MQNILISVSDKEYLTKHVLNVSNRLFSDFFVDVSDTENFNKLNLSLINEIE